MRVKNFTTKPKKLRKLFTVLVAAGFLTFAGMNIASADTDISNFSQLKSFITSGTDTTGKITNNITDVDSAIGVVTRDGLTINGNDYSIYGNSKAGFTINSSINSFVINNLDMNHFNSTSGGAIDNEGIITSITGDFSQNTASRGGAIDNTEGTIGNIIGGFIDNIANGCAGAICNSSGIIDDITGIFISNKASGSGGNGGAIDNFNGSIGDIGGNFVGNSAANDAGAICNGGGTISSLSGAFIGNYASNTAGAIWSNKTLNISNSTFEGNGYKDYSIFKKTGIATTKEGGAIYNASGANLSFTGKNIFTNNVATSKGGVIYNAGTIDFIDTNIFSNNSAKGSGGAITNYYGTISDINADFTDNYVDANSATGGAIANYYSKIGDINGNFKNNYAASSGSNYSGMGGAIVNSDSSEIGTISGDFTENYAGLSTSTGWIIGGAIANRVDSKIEGITNSKFTGNYVTGAETGNVKGGAIFNEGTITNGISNSTFIGNYTQGGTSQGGAIYNNTNINLNGTTFKWNGYSDYDDLANSATIATTKEGGAIYNASGATLNFTGTNTFTNNAIKNGTTTIANDIYNAGTLNFNGGTTSMDGGILGTGSTTVGNGTDNATLNLVYNDKNADLQQAKLTINDKGVLTVNTSKLAISNSIQNFGIINLTDGSLTSGIYSQTTGALNLDNTSLTLNQGSTINGGAVDITNSSKLVFNNYKSNSAKITMNDADSSLTIQGRNPSTGYLSILSLAEDSNITAGTVTVGDGTNCNQLYLSKNSNIAAAADFILNNKGEVQINDTAVLNLNSGDVLNGSIELENGILNIYDTISTGSTGQINTFQGTLNIGNDTNSGILNLDNFAYISSNTAINVNANSALNLSGNYAMAQLNATGTGADTWKGSVSNAGGELYFDGFAGDNAKAGVFTQTAGTTYITNGFDMNKADDNISGGTVNVNGGLNVSAGTIEATTNVTADNISIKGGTVNYGGSKDSVSGVITQTGGILNIIDSTSTKLNVTGGSSNLQNAGTKLTVGDGTSTTPVSVITTGADNALINIAKDTVLDILKGGAVTLDGGSDLSKVVWNGDVTLNGGSLLLSNIVDKTRVADPTNIATYNKTGKLIANTGNLTINASSVLLGTGDTIADTVNLTTYADITVGTGSSLALEGDEWKAGTITVAGGTLGLDGVTTANTDTAPKGARALIANTGTLNFTGNATTLANSNDTIEKEVITNVNSDLIINNSSATGIILNNVNKSISGADSWTKGITLNNGNLTLVTSMITTDGTLKYNQTGGTLNLVNTELILATSDSAITGGTVNLDPSILKFKNGVDNSAKILTSDSIIEVLGENTTLTMLDDTLITGGNISVGNNTNNYGVKNPTINFNKGKMTDGTMTVNKYGVLNSLGSVMQTAVLNNGTYNLTDGVITASIIGSYGTLNIKKGTAGKTTNASSEITQNMVTVENGATLSNDSTISSALTNNGTIDMTATDKSGSIILTGDSSNADSAKITQKNIMVDDDVKFVNDGIIKTALTNSGTITGIGSMQLTGDSTNNYNKIITQKSITVNEGVEFDNLGGYINSAIDNSGYIYWDSSYNSHLALTGNSINRTNATIMQDYVSVEPGVILTNNGYLEAYYSLINKGTINNNENLIVDGVIKNSGIINTSITSEHFSTYSNIQNSGVFNITGGNKLNHNFVGIDGSTTGIVKVSNNDNIHINSNIVDNTLLLTAQAKNLTFANTTTNIDKANLTFAPGYNGIVNLVNGAYEDLNIQKLTLNSSGVYINMDSSLPLENMDALNVTAFENIAGNVMTINPNLPSKTLSVLTNPNITLYPIDEAVTGSTRYSLAKSINAILPNEIVSPIYVYTPTYNNSNGTISVTANSFNSAALVSPVATQVGSYMSQINMYEQAFANMDMTMIMTKEQRQAMKFANKYASIEQNDVITFEPNQIPEQYKGVWFRPYATFENVNMNGGPSVDNISYGALVGGDSSLIELPHGWDMKWGVYAAYNGSHQQYTGTNIYQNGGSLGMNTSFYKGNFFIGTTGNIGANGGRAHTMYGQEDFATLASGMAVKTGYNWELFNSRLIVQPNFLISYSFMNTFDYTNGAGVNIHTDPLNAIQIAPGLKLIGNLPHGWQPYLGVQMMWNLLDNVAAQAQTVNLPEMSIDPYVQYGLGLQKSWGDRFTGYGQAMIRNGGRNGVALQFGFRYAFGTEGAKIKKGKTPKSIGANIQLSSAK